MIAFGVRVEKKIRFQNFIFKADITLLEPQYSILVNNFFMVMYRVIRLPINRIRQSHFIVGGGGGFTNETRLKWGHYQKKKMFGSFKAAKGYQAINGPAKLVLPG